MVQQKTLDSACCQRGSQVSLEVPTFMMLRVSPPLDGLQASGVAEAWFYAGGTFLSVTGVGAADFGTGLGLAMGAVVVLDLSLLSNRRLKGSR